MGADVRVRVRRGVVTVQVEQPVVLVLVVVTTHVQHNAGSVIVAIVAKTEREHSTVGVGTPKAARSCLDYLYKGFSVLLL